MENIYKRVSEANEYIENLKLDKSGHTISVYSIALNKFFGFKNINTLEDLKNITSLDCRNFQANEKEKGLKASTINSETRPLKAFYNYLLLNETVQNNPFLKVRELKNGKKMIAFFSEEEIDQLLTSCKKLEDKTIFAILFRTGIRREELTNITFDDIKGHNILIHGKGTKERIVSLPEDVYQLYLTYLEWRNKKYGMNIPYIFVSKMRCKYAGESIRSKIKTAMERAGFPKDRILALHTHSTRHTFMADFLGNGADIKMAQVALGHSNMALTSELYSHIRSSALEKAMRAQKPIV